MRHPTVHRHLVVHKIRLMRACYQSDSKGLADVSKDYPGFGEGNLGDSQFDNCTQTKTRIQTIPAPKHGRRL